MWQNWNKTGQQQKKKKKFLKKQEKRNSQPRPLCNLCLHSSSNPSSSALNHCQFPEPHGCTISDISSMLLHVKRWTWLQWPAVLQRKWACTTHATWQLFKKATTTEWLFPSSLRHTSAPSRAVPLALSQTFPGRSMLPQPFVISHPASEPLTAFLPAQVTAQCTLRTNLASAD